MTLRRKSDLARNSELLKDCEEELEYLQRRSILLYEKISSKLDVCRNGHIHITVLVGGLIKTKYVVTNEEDRILMHHENRTLIKDLIEDADIVSSTVENID